MDMGTNTLDIEVRPHRDGTRVSTSDANAQTSLLIVDVMLPSGGGDQLAIPQINLSISGYELDLLRRFSYKIPSYEGPRNFNDTTIRWASTSSNKKSYQKKSAGRY